MEVPMYWILILINLSEIFTVIRGTMNVSIHQEGLDLRNIRHYRDGSKSEARVVGHFPNAVVIKLPKFTDCKQLEHFKYAMKEGKGNSPATKGKFDVCCYLGGNRFYFGTISGTGQRKIIFFPQRKGSSQPFAVLYGNMPDEKGAAGQKIAWHIVAGTGLGWIDLRFKFKDTTNPQYMTLWIHYRRLTFNTLNQKTESQITGTKINDHIDYSYDPYTVMPALPCPDWQNKGIYCVMLTDIVSPIPGSVERYTDYEINVYSSPVLPFDGKNKVEKKHSPDVYSFIARVWNTCDPTTTCPIYLGSLPPPSEIQQPTDSTFDWNATHGTTPSLDAFGELDVLRRNPEKIPPTAVLTLRKLWPLFLAILLIVLIVLIPLFFFCIRRRAMEERMKNWYTGTTSTGLVDYAMALPVHVRIPSANTRIRRSQGYRPAPRSRSSGR